ncbi:MAG TPA: response regulator [Kofleriaceae bacterium]
MKLLIVDGSKDERARLVTAFCDITNVIVIGAVSRLHTALHAIGQSLPDILITDVRLGDDEDATALIAAARRSACPPAIVVFASEDSPDDRRRCIEAGADRFVLKDAGFTALQRAVFEVNVSRQSIRRLPYENAFAGRIAGGLAHDLNNQLTVVAAALGLATKQLGATPPRELVLASRALDTAIALSEALSRHSQRVTRPTSLVDLAKIVKQSIDLFGRSIPMGVDTSLALEATPPISAVEPELEQLVMNLVLDACDSLATGGTVTVRVHAPSPSKVQLVVSRTGNAAPVHVDFEAATDGIDRRA